MAIAHDSQESTIMDRSEPHGSRAKKASHYLQQPGIEFC